MKRLHVPIVGRTGRSDPGYVRLSVRPVGQTGSVIGRPTSQSVRPVGRSVHTLHASTVGSAVGRNQTCLILPTICPTGRTKRLHDTIVGPTSRTDQSDRPVGPTIGTCKHPVTVGG